MGLGFIELPVERGTRIWDCSMVLAPEPHTLATAAGTDNTCNKTCMN